MVVTVRDRIKEKLNELKKEKSKTYYSFELTFDAIEFNKHFNNYKNFWHALTQSFFGPKEFKKSNGEWYSSLQSEGFYFFTESHKLVQFRVYLEVKKKIDVEELEIRVQDIAPLEELKCYENDEYQFNKMFSNDIFKIQKSEIQYFGLVDNDENEDKELPF